MTQRSGGTGPLGRCAVYTAVGPKDVPGRPHQENCCVPVQDRLIDFMRRMHETHTCEEVMLKMERWMAEHRQVRSPPKRSYLLRQAYAASPSHHGWMPCRTRAAAACAASFQTWAASSRRSS